MNSTIFYINFVNNSELNLINFIQNNSIDLTQIRLLVVKPFLTHLDKILNYDFLIK